MGLVSAKIYLSNPSNTKLSPVNVDALVDSEAITVCIPEHIAVQLDLQEIEKREVTVANGARISVPYVGPLRVQFANRSCFTGALVLGDTVLLGAIPMEDMDLVIHPKLRALSVNPDSPNMPSVVVKTLCAVDTYKP